jgi:2-polyprenyl-3-methyl-5-hydroxy-6-metoxy-1,4-benzoquinol methylase
VSGDAAPGLLTPFLIRRRARAALPHLHGTVLDHGCGPGGLADVVPAERYLGYDPDPAILEVAYRSHPDHCFVGELAATPTFDTVASLAVIEHVPDPAAHLRELASHLQDGGRIVLSTPSPASRRVYTLGARLGVFSSRASEEHTYLGRPELEQAASAAGLRVASYTTFMAGANQLAVLERA